MLERHHPVWVSTHFNHPKELTPEAEAACDRLLRAGVPVQNQTVLLKGINDDIDIMRALNTGLVRARVRPYYLYHCDNVTGVSQFQTSLSVGREIMRQLEWSTTGFAVPEYVITTTIGKIRVDGDHLTDEGESIRIQNAPGETLRLELPYAGGAD
jgi:lysine 2,3-aminomutase